MKEICTMPLLQVEHIYKTVGDKSLLNDISFMQQASQKIAVTGESGAGKTTLLKIIAGHGQADKGTVFFNNEKVFGIDEKLLPGHKGIGYLSQHYEVHNNYFVEDLLWFENTLPKQSATELFKICRIYHLLKRKSQTLSGGEKQRVALCMLLIKQPTLLVLDEPFSNLDLINTNTLKNVLEDVEKSLKITCLLSSHEPHDTLAWADIIIVIKDGKLLQQGTPKEIYYQPVNEYVAGLFGRYVLLNDEQLKLISTTQHIHQINKKILLRPEQFMLSTQDEFSTKAIIQKINFYGNYSEIIADVNGISIYINTLQLKLNKGDEIFIKVDFSNPWFL